MFTKYLREFEITIPNITFNYNYKANGGLNISVFLVSLNLQFLKNLSYGKFPSKWNKDSTIIVPLCVLAASLQAYSQP